MTHHDASADTPRDPLDAAVDQRLTAAVRAARTATRPPDRHAFLAKAQTRRDRLRRRRRGWVVAAPIAAAAVVLVTIGVVAIGGGHTQMNASTGTKAAAGVDSATPIRVSPDRGIADGQIVRVSAYRAGKVTFSQCAVVRSPDDHRYYACLQNPTDQSRAVPGRAPAGADDARVATGSLTVHARLRGRLHLLTYPEGGATELIIQGGDVSCTGDTIPTVTPVAIGTDTDTTAPTTVGGSPHATGPDAASTRDHCVVMASGLFYAVQASPLVAAISFADAGTPTPTATHGTVTVRGSLADVQITPSGDSVQVRVRPAGSQTYGKPHRIDGPNNYDAWTDGPIGLPHVTIHVIGLPRSSHIAETRAAADLVVGTAPCGRYSCVVYEVPRDRSGPAPVLKVTSGGRTSTVTLDSVPVAAGILRFHTDG